MPFDKLSLSGRVAVVVGGTSGIGRSLALGLAEAGADVVATGRREAQVESVAREIESRGARTIRKPADATSRPSLSALLEATTGAFDKVDILVNCAGTTKRTPTCR
jgi:NAD(P)-dependent dehydrogenase (short-subunit alcohol dehydrogenase family)